MVTALGSVIIASTEVLVTEPPRPLLPDGTVAPPEPA